MKIFYKSFHHLKSIFMYKRITKVCIIKTDNITHSIAKDKITKDNDINNGNIYC